MIKSKKIISIYEPNDIYKVIEVGKNNSKTMLKIENISYNLKINEDAFDFKEDDYEGYYIEKI